LRFNSSLSNSSFQRIVLIALATAGLAAQVFAQGFDIESKSPPSVVGAGPFVSLEGRFSIALPQGIHSFRPLAVDSPAGKMRGDAYLWTMKEGDYTASYVDAPQPMEDADSSARIFANIRNRSTNWVASKNGKIISDKLIELDKHPALELKLQFPEGLLWQRFYVVSKRQYQVVLLLKTDQRTYEEVAGKVLDSFKILSDAEVATALKAKAAAAEPSPLPQEPVAARVGSDATDDSLHGAVKTVLKEVEDLSGTWPVQGRKKSLIEYYNPRGNFLQNIIRHSRPSCGHDIF